MASLPTHEDIAREILNIFVSHFNCRAGAALGTSNFMAVWHKRGLATEDFQPGMQFAVQQGWVEVSEAAVGNNFKLTAAGYSQA